MTKLRIEPELRDLIPPLSEQEMRDLRESIERRGIETPLVYAELNGENVLIDGHHRYQIAQALNRYVPCRKFEFSKAGADDEDAKLKEVRMWMIDNVINHRNVERFELIRLVYIKNRIMFGQKVKAAQIRAGRMHGRGQDSFGPNDPNLSESEESADKYSMVSGFTGVPIMTCKRAIFIIDVAMGWNKPGRDYAHKRNEAKDLIRQIRDKSREKPMSITKAYNRLHRKDNGLEILIPEEKIVDKLPKLVDDVTSLAFDTVAARAAKREEGEVEELLQSVGSRS